MDREAFWVHIQEARAGKRNNAKTLKALKSRLERITAEEVADFQNHFDACMQELYRWDVWGAAFVMDGGCGDDSFEYWRAMLISLGQEAYNIATTNPDALADLPLTGDASKGEWDFEDLLYLADEIYQKKTGTELPVKPSTGSAGPTGDPWDEEDVQKNYPRIEARFWGNR